MKTMQDLDLCGKRVLMRVDFNVPIRDGRVTHAARLQAAIPSIKQALAQGAAVILLSHLGRPQEGEFNAEYSLKVVADSLSELLQQPVKFIADTLSDFTLAPGEVALCENVRFLKGETTNDAGLAKRFAAMADVFVMDAFGSAHRAHASTYGVAKFAKVSCAGLLLSKEIAALEQAMRNPRRPMVAIVGGAKVSSKLGLLEHLLTLVESLILGGGIANTFLSAAGFPVGKSLIEKSLIPQAEKLLKLAQARGVAIPLPEDVVVAKAFSSSAVATIKAVTDIAEDDLILDIGPKTGDTFANLLQDAGTIVWNGPVGVFEYDAFAQGTKRLAEAVAASQAFSIAGGGDTLAAMDKFAVTDAISYSSTGGGAFLEFLQGKTLPGIEILNA